MDIIQPTIKIKAFVEDFIYFDYEEQTLQQTHKVGSLTLVNFARH